MGKKSCSVRTCCNNNRKLGRLSWFTFPLDADLCEKWVEFCNEDSLNDRLVLRGPSWLHHSGHYVCSDHFESKCFHNPNNKSQGLRKGSFPTISAETVFATRFICKCEKIESYKTKFIDERMRGADLVKEHNAIKEKLKQIRSSYRKYQQSIKRASDSIDNLKSKARRVVIERGITINLSDEESSVEEESVVL